MCVTWSYHASWFLLNSTHNSKAACTVESFVLNHSLSSVVFKSRSLLRTACGHQPITLAQITATPFVNIYTVYQQELQGMLEYTKLHIITLTCVLNNHFRIFAYLEHTIVPKPSLLIFLTFPILLHVTKIHKFQSVLRRGMVT